MWDDSVLFPSGLIGRMNAELVSCVLYEIQGKLHVYSSIKIRSGNEAALLMYWRKHFIVSL